MAQYTSPFYVLLGNVTWTPGPYAQEALNKALEECGDPEAAQEALGPLLIQFASLLEAACVGSQLGLLQGHLDNVAGLLLADHEQDTANLD